MQRASSLYTSYSGLTCIRDQGPKAAKTLVTKCDKANFETKQRICNNRYVKYCTLFTDMHDKTGIFCVQSQFFHSAEIFCTGTAYYACDKYRVWLLTILLVRLLQCYILLCLVGPCCHVAGSSLGFILELNTHSATC